MDATSHRPLRQSLLEEMGVLALMLLLRVALFVGAMGPSGMRWSSRSASPS